jgi:Flp pilus assembly protein TadD
VARSGLGEALAAAGRWEEAIVNYREVLKIGPDHVESLNNLAWLLATCPKDSVRNGAEAVKLAQRADELFHGKNPEALDTLAAAYAEAGRFPEASATARKAIDLVTKEKPKTPAEDEKRKTLAAGLRARLALYDAHKPYRQVMRIRW